MLKYFIPIGIGLAVLIALFIIIPRLITAKYTGASIHIYNKTLKGVWVAYVAKIISERERVNIIKYPYVNSLFHCKPSLKKERIEGYFTYSNTRKQLFYVEMVNPGLEKTNTLENSAFQEIILKPFDKIVLNYVFRMF